MMETENKNVTISDRFICFIFTVKKVVNFFGEKVHPDELAGGFSDLGNDLAALLRWGRHWLYAVPHTCKCIACLIAVDIQTFI